MLINGYSIALICCSLAAIFVLGAASRTALRILLFWQPASDSSRQIELESETWLAALLVEFGLFLQVASLLLLILAADNFSQVLVGAMCSAGAFLANDYGLYALLVKLGGIFLYGFWIVLHRLDISSEHSPLVRIKFVYLLVLVPVLGCDFFLLSQYIRLLEPDIITSCCGVIFGNVLENGFNLIGPIATESVVVVYCLLGLLLFCSSFATAAATEVLNPVHLTVGRKVLNLVCAVLWLVFFVLSLVVITAVISPYIYAMPSHRCPFDLLHVEYNYIGIPIYFGLLSISFLGSSAFWAGNLSSYPGLDRAVSRYRKVATKFCAIALPCFYLLLGYFPAAYLILGGEY